MSVASSKRVISVACLGNPNTGKSTLFGALCGVRVQTGNYPGVTVEKRVGRMKHGDHEFDVIDLPGTYSLAPRSPDEMVSVDVLLGRRDDTQRPDVILCIVDASNLERNLFLVSQVLEFDRPVVIALNMIDVAKERGIEIDVVQLTGRIGVPVVSVQANQGTGVAELKEALAKTAVQTRDEATSPFPPAFRDEMEQLCKLVPGTPRFMVERALLDVKGWLAEGKLPGLSRELLDALPAVRERLKKAGAPVPAVEAISRYRWAGEILKGAVERPKVRRMTLGDRIDQILTHRVWGVIAFALTMFAMFLAVLYVAEPFSTLADWGVASLSAVVERAIPDGMFRSLLVDGIIGGVGGVIPFLPQILVLFAFIAILEDCGYMARAAYLMDKLMSHAGLSGKSFIPMLSSFACAIPGIMATRTIENRRDRLVTMLVAPLMSCSARVPVYALFAGAFFPTPWMGALAVLAMYVLGIVAAIGAALVIKRTLLPGATPPFVMELPTYKWPSPRIVFWRVVDAAGSFLYRAGTLIVAIAILVWAAAYFPHDESVVPREIVSRQQQLNEKIEQSGDKLSQEERTAIDDELAALDRDRESAMLENSYLGRAGKAIEPAVRPLGWDWRIGCAAIASFPAREVVVSTLGVIFREDGEDTQALTERLQSATRDDGKPLFTVATALSVMVFFSLCAQCAATIVTIRREAQSWGWAIFTFVYMTALAYVAALITYQVAHALGG
jgi:ferrous iron transport protein B